MAHKTRFIVKRRPEIDLDKLAAALVETVEAIAEAELKRQTEVGESTNKPKGATQ